VSVAWALAWAWWALERPSDQASELPRAPEPIRLSVPHVREAFHPEGKADEPFWTRRASRTGAFVDPLGHPARPFSEAHFAWDARGLRVALYAADSDITAGDVFRLSLATFAAGSKEFAVVLTPQQSTRARGFGAEKVGVDLDGTWNDPSDDDEEWVVEAAIPWDALGAPPAVAGTALRVTLERDDATSGRARVTTSHWGTRRGAGLLVLAPPLK
jgi:hypothetical protein